MVLDKFRYPVEEGSINVIILDNIFTKYAFLILNFSKYSYYNGCNVTKHNINENYVRLCIELLCCIGLCCVMKNKIIFLSSFR